MQKLAGIERFNINLPEEIRIPESDIEVSKIIPHRKELA